MKFLIKLEAYRKILILNIYATIMKFGVHLRDVGVSLICWGANRIKKL